jgi:hypothetical protein
MTPVNTGPKTGKSRPRHADVSAKCKKVDTSVGRVGSVDTPRRGSLREFCTHFAPARHGVLACDRQNCGEAPQATADGRFLRSTREHVRASWGLTEMAGHHLSDERCGARTRKGTSCRRRTYPNGRCRNHGGLSTGPKTEAGRRRIAEAQRLRWKLWRLQRRQPDTTPGLAAL